MSDDDVIIQDGACWRCHILHILCPYALSGMGRCFCFLVFTARRDSIARTSYGNVDGWLGGWLAGWVSVCHSRYCIKTTKPILKPFRPFGSPII